LSQAELVAAELENRGITQRRSADHLDLDPFADSEIIQAPGDWVISHNADDVYESAFRNLIEGLGVGHCEIEGRDRRDEWVPGLG
jgi:hypothetical protein